MRNMQIHIFQNAILLPFDTSVRTSVRNPASLASLCWGNAVPGPCKSFGNTFSKLMGGKGMKLFVMGRSL